ncbi:MAG: sialidase family protein [Candidatus Sulfotelmatobacter sp.]
MKRISPVVVLPLVTLLLLSLGTFASAQTNNSPLEKSPVSTSVLMARAIRAGKVSLSGSASESTTLPPITCSPLPCVLPNENVSQSSVLANETPVVVNPRNPQQILAGANDYSCGSLTGFYASSDGGTTWARTCIGVIAGDSGDGDPGVGYDLHGTAYISGIDASSGIVFEKSTDHGVTWSAPAVAVSPLFAGGLADKPWLQIDTNSASPHANSLYFSVTQFDANSNSQISVSHSNNGGSTWTRKTVDTEQLFPNVDQFTDIATGKDGTVYLTWIRCTANGPSGDCGGTTASIMFSKSTDGGNTWSAAAAIFSASLAPDPGACCFYGALPNTSERVSDIPVVAIDTSTGAHAGNLYVTYYNWTGTFMKVYVATSTNGGSTWTKKPVAPATATHDQFFPWLNVNRAGLVGVSWLDRRNDPANVNYEAFASFSPSGGNSFSTNQDLSAAPSNPFNDGFGGFFIGDYTGNAWAIGSESTLYVTYTDTTTGIDQDFLAGYEH